IDRRSGMGAFPAGPASEAELRPAASLRDPTDRGPARGSGGLPRAGARVYHARPAGRAGRSSTERGFVGSYHRTELRGFRRFAMVFWDAPRDGTIYGHLQMDVSKTQRFIDDVKAKYG